MERRLLRRQYDTPSSHEGALPMGADVLPRMEQLKDSIAEWNEIIMELRTKARYLMENIDKESLYNRGKIFRKMEKLAHRMHAAGRMLRQERERLRALIREIGIDEISASA